jgi:hypothetical protein
MVGPGVARGGIDNSTWSDHTDIQPTMMDLLGLRDDYVPDGRVLAEVLDPGALPDAQRADHGTLLRLGQVYNQLESAVGIFGLATLQASTRALASESPRDATYTRIESQLQRLGRDRDGLRARMRAALDGVAFNGQPLDEGQARALIQQGEHLLDQAAQLGS